MIRLHIPQKYTPGRIKASPHVRRLPHLGTGEPLSTGPDNWGTGASNWAGQQEDRSLYWAGAPGDWRLYRTGAPRTGPEQAAMWCIKTLGREPLPGQNWWRCGTVHSGSLTMHFLPRWLKRHSFSCGVRRMDPALGCRRCDGCPLMVDGVINASFQSDVEVNRPNPQIKDK